MIEIIDVWTIYHLLGGFALGLILFWLCGKRLNKRLASLFTSLPIIWEVVEQNILVSWIKLLYAESLLNSLFDIVVVVAAMFGIYYLVKKL